MEPVDRFRVPEEIEIDPENKNEEVCSAELKTRRVQK